MSTPDFKGLLKVDRVVQHLSIIPPILLPLLLFSITWNLGKVLILLPADWLAAMLSRLLTFCRALIICCWLSRSPPPPRRLLRPRNCCRCSLLERLQFVSMKLFWKRVCGWLCLGVCAQLRMHWWAVCWRVFVHSLLACSLCGAAGDWNTDCLWGLPAAPTLSFLSAPQI